jgi:hypothetical protein
MSFGKRAFPLLPTESGLLLMMLIVYFPFFNRSALVDVQGAVETALQAFKDGFYLVFIDDRQQEDLTAVVNLKTNSELLFLRLIPLVGG